MNTRKFRIVVELFFLFSAFDCYSTNPCLVAYYPFNGNAGDSSGNGNDGTVYGATLTTDRFGNANSAYSFNGISDYISATDIDLQNEFTLSAWVYPIGIIGSIISKYGNGNESYELLYNNSTYGLYGHVGYVVDTNNDIFSNHTLTLNQWQYCAMVVNNGTAKIFIDGNLVYTQSNVNPTHQNNDLVQFGKSVWGGNLFSGKLDEIRIYNCALSDSEITSLYQGCDTLPTINLPDTTFACGLSTTLDAGSGANSFLWSTGDTSQIITSSQNGWYMCTVSNGTCSATDSTFLNLLDANIINNDTTICAGQSLTLTVSVNNISQSICSSSLLPANLQNGLVAYYPFCGNANDESGNGNDGTVNGAALTNDRFGNLNSAYYFDGISNKIITNSNFQSGNQQKSFSLWVKFDNLMDRGWLLSNNSCNPATSTGFGVFLEGLSGIVNFYGDGNDAQITYNFDTINYFHIVITYTNDSIKSFVNGSLTNVSYHLLNTAMNGILFGQRFVNNMSGICGNDNSDGFFKGKLDDIGIWNRALSASEIQQIYSGTNYFWSNGATTSTINVSPTQTTTYYCTVTQNEQSCTDSVTVTVAPSPSINLPDSTFVCGTSAAIDAGTGANNYLWNTGDTTQSISATQSGWYKCTVSNGTCSASDSTYLNLLNVNIQQNDTTICSGQSLTLTASSNNSGKSVCSSSLLPSNLQNGLVAYYPFCGNANDESGNGNDGSVNGASMTTDRFGNLNSAYSFNGISDFINVSNSNSLNLNDSATFSFWMFWNGDNIYAQGSQTIINKSTTTDIENYRVAIVESTSNPANKLAILSNQIEEDSYSTINHYQWTHVAVVFKSGLMSLYINGVLNFSGALNLTATDLNDLIIGKDNVPSGVRYFFGKLDDIGIWNRALSDSEVQQLFNENNFSILWSTGDKVASINITPTQTSTYYCTVSQNGQSCSDSITVSVNPSYYSIVNASICQGSSYTLPDGQIVDSAGTYTTTLQSISDCDSVIITNLFVNTLPNVITTSNSPICPGDSLKLFASGNGNFSWTGPNGFTSNQQYPIIPNASNVNAGNYSVNIIADTDIWQQKANFGGNGRAQAVSFSIDSVGYVGTGGDVSNVKNDFWSYNPNTNTWTQKANFGGVPRTSAVGFNIGSKGYIGIGYDINGITLNDFWEYDPINNSWVEKAPFGGAARFLAVGFSIGMKGYIGTGYDNTNYYNDFWEYDPLLNSWQQKANFSGAPRGYAVGFSIGTKGYIGAGLGSGFTGDFWEYDQASNTWLQKANIGAFYGIVGFNIGNKGYVGVGSNTTDLWCYNPASDTWEQKINPVIPRRDYGTGFSIGNKGFIGLGLSTNINNATVFLNDFWEYSPATSCSSTDSTSVTLLPQTIFYADADSDGYGLTTDSLLLCAPSGIYTALIGGDCNDSNPNIHPGATEICGNGIDDNCDGQIDENCSITLQLKLFIEGFYLGDSIMQATVDPLLYPTLCDTIAVELRNPTYPYNVVYFDTSEINIYGNGTFNFPLSVQGHNYYIAVHHRNAIETWSSSPISFNSPFINYNFTNAISKAYGGNMRDLGDGNFAIWSGDISDAATGTIGRQDGVVESQDYSDMENAIFLTLLGYIPEDLTGDGIVESSDYVLMENNVYYTIFAMRP